MKYAIITASILGIYSAGAMAASDKFTVSFSGHIGAVANQCKVSADKALDLKAGEYSYEVLKTGKQQSVETIVPNAVEVTCDTNTTLTIGTNSIQTEDHGVTYSNFAAFDSNTSNLNNIDGNNTWPMTRSLGTYKLVGGAPNGLKLEIGRAAVGLFNTRVQDSSGDYQATGKFKNDSGHLNNDGSLAYISTESGVYHVTDKKDNQPISSKGFKFDLAYRVMTHKIASNGNNDHYEQVDKSNPVDIKKAWPVTVTFN
ncbi:hypothetical protein [Chromobacterium amazonense]|uniref:hypothetical protein n=1 Tax=Chromobacterium amazonense TaxID=1382803 RepID=UPI0011B29D8E|nr:hypothetical protein [Chromobacterium amazonense]